jgi:O-antigen/teichoic acid export membrane protein
VTLAFPGACLGLLIGGVTATAAVGYLFADGRPGAVVNATLGAAVATLVVTGALVPALGIVAPGLGWAAGGIVEALLLARVTKRTDRAEILRPLAFALPIAATAALAGWRLSLAVQASIGDGRVQDAVAGLAGGLGAVVCATALLGAFQLDLLRDFGAVALRSIRNGLGIGR